MGIFSNKDSNTPGPDIRTAADAIRAQRATDPALQGTVTGNGVKLTRAANRSGSGHK